MVLDEENKKQMKKQKRMKERSIADIIEKVSTWRKLYNGVSVPDASNPGSAGK